MTNREILTTNIPTKSLISVPFKNEIEMKKKMNSEVTSRVLIRGLLGGRSLLAILLLLLLLLLCHPPGTQARKKVDVFVAGFFPVSIELFFIYIEIEIRYIMNLFFILN